MKLGREKIRNDMRQYGHTSPYMYHNVLTGCVINLNGCLSYSSRPLC